jgi:hypothetical protein
VKFSSWLESTINDLYQSTVIGFPNSTKRQHATDPIRIVRLEWIPYIGLKTLYIKGLAQNPESETYDQSEYQPMILFKSVRFHFTRDQTNLVEIIANDQRTYLLEKLGTNDVLVRCDCADYRYRFAWYGHLDHSLYGRKPKKYESQGGPAANPLEMPGMCKHIIKLVQSLDHAGLLEG